MTDQTNLEILTDELHREGGYRNDPNDPGGRTQFGISERSFPQAWADGKVTAEEARTIYQKTFLDGWGIGLVQPDYLRHQVLDFSINSGLWSIMKLQQLIGVVQDGKIGPATLAAVAKQDPKLLNNRLVDERVLFICRVVQRRPQQVGDLYGLVTRALSFRI